MDANDERFDLDNVAAFVDVNAEEEYFYFNQDHENYDNDTSEKLLTLKRYRYT